MTEIPVLPTQIADKTFELLRRDAEFREEVKQKIREIEADQSICKRDKCGHKSYGHSDDTGACYECDCPMMVI